MDTQMNLRWQVTQHSRWTTPHQKKTATYYATEYMNGEKRYDYAMIDFVSDDGLKATCPSMILGFLWYNITFGIPTPHFSDEEGQSLHTIQDNMALDKIFMWWYTRHLIMYQLNDFNMNLCHPLHLGIFQTVFTLSKGEALYGPLFVFRNYGSVGDDKNQLFCELPKSKWGKYFDDKIH
jgi:hypothetical protein